jgi:hypothetical protein
MHADRLADLAQRVAAFAAEPWKPFGNWLVRSGRAGHNSLFASTLPWTSREARFPLMAPFASLRFAAKLLRTVAAVEWAVLLGTLMARVDRDRGVEYTSSQEDTPCNSRASEGAKSVGALSSVSHPRK